MQEKPLIWADFPDRPRQRWDVCKKVMEEFVPKGKKKGDSDISVWSSQYFGKGPVWTAFFGLHEVVMDFSVLGKDSA